MHAIMSFVKKFFPISLLKFTLHLYMETRGNIRRCIYGGSAVFCPCCGKKFRQFVDHNIKSWQDITRYRQTYKNKICPYCFSVPRHRIICYYLDKNNICGGGGVMMFGAERSIKKWFNRNGYRYTTADLFERDADVKVDIQNIQFADETYKLIICNHVLEHVPDYKKSLCELRRILKNDGILELTVPTDRDRETVYEDMSINSEKERIKTFGQIDHLRIFGDDFEKILIEAGFYVEIVDGKTLPAEIGGEIGPANYDDNRVYICRKK